MTVYLASGNAHKAREFQALADGLAPVRRLPVEIISAAAMGGMPQVVEDAGSFTGNARKKARALQDRLPAGAWALADDSGLCVDALAGAPGVESAYYAGPRASGASSSSAARPARRPWSSAGAGRSAACSWPPSGSTTGSERVSPKRSGHRGKAL